MQKQEIQIVGAEIGKRSLHRRRDMRCAGVVVRDPVVRTALRDQHDIAFGDELDVLAPALPGSEASTEGCLDAVIAIDVGMVETGQTKIDGRADKARHGQCIGALRRVEQPPCPENQPRQRKLRVKRDALLGRHAGQPSDRVVEGIAGRQLA